MEGMSNRMRRATSQGTGAAPPATPLGASQETRHQDGELGRAACPRCLSLVPRAHRHNTPHLARLLPCGIPCRIRTEATRHPGHDVRGLRRSCRGARPQARDQRRPGDWDPRRSEGRSPWRTSTGSAARATGARPGWTAGSRGSFRPARWTGGEPGGPGDSTAPGRACSSLLSG